jgi:serine/threonine protein kinase
MTEEFWDRRKKRFAKLSMEDPPGLVRLMRRMLVLDPAKRPSAQELLDDPYFSCSNGARNVVGSTQPLMRLPTGIPHGEEADLQTNRSNLPTLD